MTFSWRLLEAPADQVLAVYGTLRPGQSNFDVVASIDGTWLAGTIRGTLGRHPSGQYAGYPAFRREPSSGDVEVDVLVSPELPDHWERLDRFEGPGYRRVVVEVSLTEEPPADRPATVPLQAYVYESWPEGELGPGR